MQSADVAWARGVIRGTVANDKTILSPFCRQLNRDQRGAIRYFRNSDIVAGLGTRSTLSPTEILVPVLRLKGKNVFRMERRRAQSDQINFLPVEMFGDFGIKFNETEELDNSGKAILTAVAVHVPPRHGSRSTPYQAW